MGELNFKFTIENESFMKRIKEIERGIADVTRTAEEEGRRIDVSLFCN